MIGELIGGYLASKFADEPDGMFLGLGTMSGYIRVIGVFLLFWIFSIIGGVALGINFLDRDKN